MTAQASFLVAVLFCTAAIAGVTAQGETSVFCNGVQRPAAETAYTLPLSKREVRSLMCEMSDVVKAPSSESARNASLGCPFEGTWSQVWELKNNGTYQLFTGALGEHMVRDQFEVWICFLHYTCEGAPGPLPGAQANSMCWVYNEARRLFVPWGYNSDLKVFYDGSDCTRGPCPSTDEATDEPTDEAPLCADGYVFGNSSSSANLARSCPAGTASCEAFLSNEYYAGGGASRVTDGDMTTMAHSALGYTAGTDTGTTEPWVRVDLQFERRIGTVILKYVTGGCCVSRMNNLQVRVGNSSDNFEENAVCASLATAANANVLPCDAVGRYVFVVLVGDNRMLNIHEVEVYGVDRMNECVEEVEGVSPCYEVGYFYDTAAKACVPCTNYKPDGASYTTNGGVRNYCDWVCDSTSDQFVNNNPATSPDLAQACGGPCATAQINTEGVYSADLAVDGVYGAGNGASTSTTIRNWGDQGSTDPWWRVDLGSTQAIGYVLFFNAPNSNSWWQDGIEIRVGDSATVTDNAVCATIVTHADSYRELLECNGVGRYVFVRRPGIRRIMFVNEVQVYGPGAIDLSCAA